MQMRTYLSSIMYVILYNLTIELPIPLLPGLYKTKLLHNSGLVIYCSDFNTRWRDILNNNWT